MKKKHLIFFILPIIILLLIDYFNLPSLLGFEMSNINWDFCMGFLSIVVVITLYSFTYKLLDEKAIKREKNKNEISALLLKECYKECLEYSDLLTKDIIENYIVPKIDFNCIIDDNSIIRNLQNSPFESENIIMDFAKDGQLTTEQIQSYYNVKNYYRKSITMRIIAFDNPDIHREFNRINLQNVIDCGLKTFDEYNMENKP